MHSTEDALRRRTPSSTASLLSSSSPSSTGSSLLSPFHTTFRRAFASTTSRHAVSSTGAKGPVSQTGTPLGAAGQAGEAEADADFDPDRPPPKATLKERLRFLSRRYGWWALGVYLLMSLVDFSLVLVAIHFLGAEHIRSIEGKVRDMFGMGKRSKKEEEHTGQGLKEILGVGTGGEEPTAENNAAARREAIAKRDAAIKGTTTVTAEDSKDGNSSSQWLSSSMWAEVVLAYTIHKTLLLPFRIAATAAVLPSFVKLMVRWGLSKPNAVVRAAAKKKAAAGGAAATAAVAVTQSSSR